MTQNLKRTLIKNNKIIFLTLKPLKTVTTANKDIIVTG